LDLEQSDFIVGIGLSQLDSFVSKRIPEFDEWNIGYHSDDRGIFIDDRIHRFETETHIERESDTVWCGIELTRKQIFFSKNGENDDEEECSMEQWQHSSVCMHCVLIQ